MNTNSLGYEFPLAETKEQIQKIINLPTTVLFIAESNDGVVGYIQLSDYENTYHKSLKNIVTLAVDSSKQAQGVGSQLLAAGEQWAKENGADGIRLVTGFERKAARKFYEKNGYQVRKDQTNYIKWWK
ncbi:GNAT family N-acetyltransferase [Companilactobacillus nantensis]|uniref:GNAT family N-acetyltransferase n=1 Tax=Companilactobacillus nantensis TaxID=305793 RepID=UPI003B849FAA